MIETLSNSLLLLWAGLPVMMWLFRLVVPKRIHVIILYIFTVAIGYFVFVGCAWASDVLLEQRMNSFDLDGDGGIGGDELTPEAQQAIDEWASDTGRTMAPHLRRSRSRQFGTQFCSHFFLVANGFFEKHYLTRSTSENQQTNSELEEQQTDDGNPYRPPSVG